MTGKDDVSLKFAEVAVGVGNALRREFGSAAEIDIVSQENDSATFGFTVDGYSYSLRVNVTP